MMAILSVVNALLKHQWPQQNGLENTLTLKAGFFNSEYMYRLHIFEKVDIIMTLSLMNIF